MTWYKQASTKNLVPGEEVKSKIQDQWICHLGDYQKWPTDAYDCAIVITETNYKIGVSINIQTAHSGTMMFQFFWKYGLDEKDRAKKTYKAAIEAVAKIVKEISDEEMPSSLFESMTRADCLIIDPERIAKTTVPVINWAQKTKYERDWRSSIYGNRYPGPTEIHGY